MYNSSSRIVLLLQVQFPVVKNIKNGRTIYRFALLLQLFLQFLQDCLPHTTKSHLPHKFDKVFLLSLSQHCSNSRSAIRLGWSRPFVFDIHGVSKGKAGLRLRGRAVQIQLRKQTLLITGSETHETRAERYWGWILPEPLAALAGPY